MSPVEVKPYGPAARSVIITVPGDLYPEDAAKISQQARALLPGVNVAVIGGGATATVP